MGMEEAGEQFLVRGSLIYICKTQCFGREHSDVWRGRSLTTGFGLKIFNTDVDIYHLWQYEGKGLGRKVIFKEGISFQKKIKRWSWKRCGLALPWGKAVVNQCLDLESDLDRGLWLPGTSVPENGSAESWSSVIPRDSRQTSHSGLSTGLRALVKSTRCHGNSSNLHTDMRPVNTGNLLLQSIV